MTKTNSPSPKVAPAAGKKKKNHPGKKERERKKSQIARSSKETSASPADSSVSKSLFSDDDLSFRLAALEEENRLLRSQSAVPIVAPPVVNTPSPSVSKDVVDEFLLSHLRLTEVPDRSLLVPSTTRLFVNMYGCALALYRNPPPMEKIVDEFNLEGAYALGVRSALIGRHTIRGSISPEAMSLIHEVMQNFRVLARIILERQIANGPVHLRNRLQEVLPLIQRKAEELETLAVETKHGLGHQYTALRDLMEDPHADVSAMETRKQLQRTITDRSRGGRGGRGGDRGGRGRGAGGRGRGRGGASTTPPKDKPSAERSG
jgi:hypothetical protein